MTSKKTAVNLGLCYLIALSLITGDLNSPVNAQAPVAQAPVAQAPVAQDPGAQDPSVLISVGQPNIWSLEQAHYLLARMRRESLDLESRTPTITELDPNSINISRLDSLKSVLNVGANFDQGVRFQNDLLVSNGRFNLKRRQELQSKKDQLQEDSVRTARELAVLNLDLAKLKNSGGDESSIDLKNAEITQKTAEHAAFAEQLNYVTTELGTLTAVPSGAPQTATAPEPPAKSDLPDSLLDKLIGTSSNELKGLLRDDPKLAASTILDNHIQMQYELIAKQLTLLRDEAGPGQRVVFLELPTSIYTSASRADEKLAQVWWHVNGYVKFEEKKKLETDLASLQELLKNHANKRDEKRGKVAVYLDKVKLLEDMLKVLRKRLKDVETQLTAESAERGSVEQAKPKRRRSVRRNDRDSSGSAQNVSDLEQQAKAFEEKIITVETEIKELRERVRKDEVLQSDLAQYSMESATVNRLKDAVQQTEQALTQVETKEALETASRIRQGGAQTQNKLLGNIQQDNLGLFNAEKTGFDTGGVIQRLVRTIDLIPRQSSLNVNEIQDTVKSMNLSGAFSFLFGFGAKVSYQRQRQLFEQYMHQEVYASGFGKGAEDFGWTFGPLPGTKRLAPGLRTTYAVLVVPDDAVAIQLAARGCSFPRRGDSPASWMDTSKTEKFKCSTQGTYTIPVPGGRDNNFWVTKVRYRQVEPGQRTVVSIEGEDFSTQTGVLINGIPLVRSIGVARPELAIGRDKDLALELQDSGVIGSYELIGTRQVIASFVLPKEFKGTPDITLVAPGKAVNINRLKLQINDDFDKSLQGTTAMFGVDEPATPLSLDALKIFVPDPTKPDQVVAHLIGAKFSNGNDSIFINGDQITAAKPVLLAADLYKLEFHMPNTDEIDVTLIQKGDSGDKSVSKSFPNPFRVRIDHVTVVDYEPRQKKTRGSLTVKLTGSGIGSATIASPRGARLHVLSPDEALLEIPSPGAVVIISLKDRSGQIATTVITPRSAEAGQPAP